MSVHPASGPVGDPFLARVRRRHPDLDLVLLPPEPPEAGRPVPPEPGAEQALVSDRAEVEAEARQRGIDAPVVIARGTRPGTVCARVRAFLGERAVGERVVEVVGPDRAVGAARARQLAGEQ